MTFNHRCIYGGCIGLTSHPAALLQAIAPGFACETLRALHRGSAQRPGRPAPLPPPRSAAPHALPQHARLGAHSNPAFSRMTEICLALCRIHTCGEAKQVLAPPPRPCAVMPCLFSFSYDWLMTDL